MSKIKDKLFSEIIRLSGKHGFTVDKEMLEKVIKKQEASDLTNDELIHQCRNLLAKTYSNGNHRDYELLSELINRYSNLLDKDDCLESKEDIVENKNESSKEKEFVIKTNNGDIQVKVIKPDEMSNKPFNDKLSSYYDEFLSYYFAYKRR